MPITEQEQLELRNAIVEDVRGIISRLETELKEGGNASTALRTELENAKAQLKEAHDGVIELRTVLARPGMGISGGETKSITGRPMEVAEAHRTGFFSFLRRGNLDGLSDMQVKALVEDATGQILVPEELEAEIYREIPKITVMRGLASQRTIRGDRIRRRSMTEVTVGWGKLEKGAGLVESNLTPSQDWQYVEDQNGLTKVGKDELMDTDIALESIISDSFARALGEHEDTGFFTGRGHDYEEPEGIMLDAAIAKVDAAQAAAIKFDDCMKLRQAVPAQYRAGSVFVMNSTTELSLMVLKDKQDGYLWQPSVQAGKPNLLLGYPVYNQENLADIPAGGSTANPILFGNVQAAYRIVDRKGMTMERLTELYTTAGLVGFLVNRRVTGGVVRPNAVRILRVPAA